MKVIEDPKFSGPIHIHPQYHPQQRVYLFQYNLANSFETPLHFYIASTFGCCLQQTSKVKVVQANSSVMLNFRLKLTNLLGNAPETMAIYGSKCESGQLFPLGGCYLVRTQLHFNEDNKIDPAVQEILEVEVEACVGEATQFKSKGDWAKALNKYQQAYEIMRKSQTAAYGMVNSRLALKDWTGAIRDLEAILVQRFDNPKCLLAKIKVIMQWQDKKIQQKSEIYDYINAALRFIKENYHLYYLAAEEKSELEQLEKEFKKYERLTQGEVNLLLKHLYDRALDKFSEGHPATKLYSSKQQFQQEVRQLLLEQKSQEIATPEQVLDPISYQIMKKPYILPSGNSCEEQSLRAYFTTNGYKDPITRQPINYTFVFPNTNLQTYITEHPQLKIWQKYQFDYIHH